MDYFDEVKGVVDSLKGFGDDVDKVSEIIYNGLIKGNTLFACGNGGSFADAQHLVAEISVRFREHRKAYSAMALSANNSVVTAIGNDYSFEDIFKRDLEAHGKKGDILIVITTSGNSENIVRVVEHAKENGVLTIALLGKGGGKLKGMCDYEFIVDSRDTGIIQIGHATLYNRICELVDKELMKHG